MITTQMYIRTFQSKEHADLYIQTIYRRLKEIIERESIAVSWACHQDDKEGNKVVTIWEYRSKEDREKIVKILSNENLSLLPKSLSPKVSELSLNKIMHISKTAKISFKAFKS